MADQEDIIRVIVRSRNRQALHAALAEHGIDTGCTSFRVGSDGTFEIEGYGRRSTIDRLKAALTTRFLDGELEILEMENVSETFAAKKAQVGAGTRFRSLELGRPRGLGSKE
jgi:hypothetical protein